MYIYNIRNLYTCTDICTVSVYVHFEAYDITKNLFLFVFFQAFVRFSAGDKEIFYVTKHSTETGDYSFELDVNEAATDFGSLSNSYAMVGHQFVT